LGHGGGVERFGWTFEADLTQIETDDGVGSLEEFRCDGEGIGDVGAHAYELGPLSGKEKSGAHGSCP
jgi:hypothetical protein